MPRRKISGGILLQEILSSPKEQEVLMGFMLALVKILPMELPSEDILPHLILELVGVLTVFLLLIQALLQGMLNTME